MGGALVLAQAVRSLSQPSRPGTKRARMVGDHEGADRAASRLRYIGFSCGWLGDPSQV
jgi:hypothetical protein